MVIVCRNFAVLDFLVFRENLWNHTGVCEGEDN